MNKSREGLSSEKIGRRWFQRWLDPRQRDRLQVLAQVPLFYGLAQRQLGKLLIKLFERNYQAGEMIFARGEAGKALFIVISGKISIFRSHDEMEEELAVLTTGSYFGELALIDDQPRSASARAVEASVLLILYKTDFDDLIESHKAIATQVMTNLLRTLAGYIRGAQFQSSSRAAPLAGVISVKAKTG